jgi:thiol-disulfide isomerase/thioredoxin
MRLLAPRPVSLALTLLLIAGAIALIELRLDASGTDATADARANPPTSDPPAVEERGDPPRKVEDQTAPQCAEGESAAERIARKEAEFERAKEIVAPTGFINTDGISIEEAAGEKVVLLEFWTYSCYNCQNTHPYVNAWHEEYEDDGLLVIGVHKPEFEFEKDPASVREAVRQANIEYPVVLDNNDATWDTYDQRYWPARYLIDADGFIRYKHFGEGAYEETEKKIQELLAEKDRIVN